MHVRIVLFAFVLLKFHQYAETVLKDPECEIYNMMKDYSSRAYFTCIRDSTLPTLYPTRDCRDIGRDWRVIGNRTVYVCDGDKLEYKLRDQGKWTTGHLLEHKKCTDPDKEKQIVAYRLECVLLTRQKYKWDDAVNACNSIGADQHWRIIENITYDKQVFLERFLNETFLSDEVWIGLHAQGGRVRWNSVEGNVNVIHYVDPRGEGHPPPQPSGDCYATGAAGTDRIGGGWRGRPCNDKFHVLCQASGSNAVVTSPRVTEAKVTSPRVTDARVTTYPFTRTETFLPDRTQQVSTEKPTCVTGEPSNNDGLGNWLTVIIIIGALSMAIFVISLLLICYIGRILRTQPQQLPSDRVSYHADHYDNPL